MSAAASTEPGEQAPSANDDAQFYVAIRDVPAAGPEDLMFIQGDLVTVVRKESDLVWIVRTFRACLSILDVPCFRGHARALSVGLIRVTSACPARKRAPPSARRPRRRRGARSTTTPTRRPVLVQASHWRPVK